MPVNNRSCNHQEAQTAKANSYTKMHIYTKQKLPGKLYPSQEIKGKQESQKTLLLLECNDNN